MAEIGNNTIGAISSNTFSVDWKIENFSSLPEADDGYQSPSFECFDVVWNLSLFPDGSQRPRSGCISVYINKQEPRNSKNVVDVKISVKCDDEIMHTCNGWEIIFPISVGWSTVRKKSEVLEKLRASVRKVLTISCAITLCTSVEDTEPEDRAIDRIRWNMFLKRSEVLEKLRAPIRKVLIISCAITLSTPVEGIESQDRSLENASISLFPNASLETLIRNLKDLYMNQRNCDFTIKVKDKELKAHKVILGARSSVFAAAFAHDMAENRSGTMEIDDFEPDTVEEFLTYVYTGVAENLSCENVFELYVISDKYDVQDLGKECLRFMIRNLSLETVCGVLLLAEKYNEAELFRLAKYFVAKCAGELLRSDRWEKFASENALLAQKVLDT